MIYCGACHWTQDDFYDPSGKRLAYTPLREDLVQELREALFRDRIHFDVGFFRDHKDLPPDGADEKGPWIKGTKYVAWDLRRRAKRIESMVWLTGDDWQRDVTETSEKAGRRQWPSCPSCHKDELRSD